MAAACGDDWVHPMGLVHRMAWMVGKLCVAGRLHDHPDLHDDHIKDSIPFAAGVYDLLCHGSGIWNSFSVHTIIDKGHHVYCPGGGVRGIKLLIPACAYPV